MSDNPHLYDLFAKIAEISADVKHILARAENQDGRIKDLEDRVRVQEAFRWKITGIAVTVPTALVLISWYLKGLL